MMNNYDQKADAAWRDSDCDIITDQFDLSTTNRKQSVRSHRGENESRDNSLNTDKSKNDNFNNVKDQTKSEKFIAKTEPHNGNECLRDIKTDDEIIQSAAQKPSNLSLAENNSSILTKHNSHSNNKDIAMQNQKSVDTSNSGNHNNTGKILSQNSDTSNKIYDSKKIGLSDDYLHNTALGGVQSPRKTEVAILNTGDIGTIIAQPEFSRNRNMKDDCVSCLIGFTVPVIIIFLVGLGVYIFAM